MLCPSLAREMDEKKTLQKLRTELHNKTRELLEVVTKQHSDKQWWNISDNNKKYILTPFLSKEN